MHIETVNKDTFDAFLTLIAKYQTIYKAVPNMEQNRSFFSQFLHDHSRGIQFIAFDNDEKAIGFIALYFTFSSISAIPLCILNDLYVDRIYKHSSLRSMSNKLIEHAFKYAVGKGFKRISGVADHDNVTAQGLYDAILERYPQYSIKKTVIVNYSAYYNENK